MMSWEMLLPLLICIKHVADYAIGFETFGAALLGKESECGDCPEDFCLKISTKNVPERGHRRGPLRLQDCVSLSRCGLKAPRCHGITARETWRWGPGESPKHGETSSNCAATMSVRHPKLDKEFEAFSM